MSSSGALINANHRTRTLVLRDPRSSTWPALRATVVRMWNRLPLRLRAFARWLAQPKAIIVLAIIAATCFVAVVYYYNKFANEIDLRLSSNSLDNSLGIFTAPFRVSVGDRLSIDDLSDYLRKAGYQQRPPSSDENVAGSFEIDGNAVLVVPSDAASSRTAVAPVRVQVDKFGRVASLSSPLTGERLSSAGIEGALLASVRDGDRRKRKQVQFGDIPDNLRNAIVAAEDRRFFSHNGVDWRGIVRALRADIDQGEFVQGGSTLTQQIIKNNFLTAERSLSRKLKEAAMAVILESRLTKEQIFTLYCNDVYLGQSGTFAIRGFGQASQVYFDKDLNELTLGQSAFLAALICAPNRYSAHRDQARAIERRNVVLDAMVQTDAITRDEAEAAKTEQLQIKTHATEDDDGTSYFIDYVQRSLEARYGPAFLSSQPQITTTIDPRLQRAAYAAVRLQTAKLDKVFTRRGRVRKAQQPEPVQAALVALDAHTGEVLAMVGGRSYDESQLNRATDARRQPGSAFKPFVYATALSSRSFTAASMLSDRPQAFSYDGGRSEYTPSDYHGGFTNRNVTLREALQRSLNVPAVELAMSTGLTNVAAIAEASGLDKPRIYPSMALGTSEVTPLQLAGAYTAFANDGTALRPTPLKSISRGGTASEQVRASSARVFSPQVAYLMTSLMQTVVDQGTASRLRGMGLKGAIAGKTGTSSDAWFVGYTPKIVCVAWVGFDGNRDLGMKASDAALPMWADFMKQALELRPELGGEAFGKPGGIVAIEIDPTTGCVAGPESAARRLEIFIAGTQPSDCFQPAVADAEQIPGTDEELPIDASGSLPAEESDADEQVTVEVCALTGLIASIDCPRTEKRAFKIDLAPRITCRAEFHTDGR